MYRGAKDSLAGRVDLQLSPGPLQEGLLTEMPAFTEQVTSSTFTSVQEQLKVTSKKCAR